MLQTPGTHAYRLHFVGGHFQASPPQGLRRDLLGFCVYRDTYRGLAMRTAGGLPGPRGLAVPLEAEYMNTIV